MKIKVTEITYRFDENGDILSIEVQYQAYEGGNNFSARVVLENGNFTEMTHGDIEKEAQKKINEWVNNGSE